MSSHIKLKPCPFCGGEAQLLIVGKRPNGDEEWYVSCNSENCSLYPHSTIPYVSAEIAAKVWNSRAENTRSAPVGNTAAMRELKALKEAVLDFCDVFTLVYPPNDGDCPAVLASAFELLKDAMGIETVKNGKGETNGDK